MRAIIIILLSIVVFSSIIFANQSYGESRTCKSGFELILKATTEKPVCVKPSTAEKLVLRGWGIMPTNHVTPVENKTPKQSEPTEITSTNLIESNNQFAMDFYSQIKDDEENIFFSPWSISTAFALVYEGAKGTTADETQNVFRFLKDKQEQRSSFKSINDNLNEKDSSYKLLVANALWIAEGFQPFVEYVDNAKTFYDSEVSNVDFITDQGVNTINKWVKEKTEEKIQKLFPLGSTNQNTLLIITNAIYFNGTWANQFEEKNTIDEDFLVSPDNVVTAPMMKLYDTKFNYSQNEQLQIIELPYDGNKLSMFILLPNDADGLESIEESLSLENLTQLQSELGETSLDVVQIPKFILETDYDLKEKLSNLGVHSAFDPGDADFSGIAQVKPLYIQAAVHKAYVDVNEVGTEAAAATGIQVGTTSARTSPLIFKADHPFIFLIQDHETGNILFLGRIINPTE